tara:strand:+ start:510 stop:668 length:159 start_codon:yes stop_codon:yes gene_type:complete
MSEQRTDEEYAQALKVIKILIKNKILPVAQHEEAYLRTYDTAFEIIDLLNKH